MTDADPSPQPRWSVPEIIVAAALLTVLLAFTTGLIDESRPAVAVLGVMIIYTLSHLLIGFTYHTIRRC